MLWDKSQTRESEERDAEPDESAGKSPWAEVSKK